MDEKRMDEILEVLRDIQQNEKQEMAYAKKQSRVALITSFCSLAIVLAMAIVIVSILPQVNTLMKNANETVVKINTLMEETDDIVANLNRVTSDLVEMDYVGIVKDIDDLVDEAEGSIVTAMDKLNTIDFETLNNAIQELEAVVAPLARLFGKKV